MGSVLLHDKRAGGVQHKSTNSFGIKLCYRRLGFARIPIRTKRPRRSPFTIPQLRQHGYVWNVNRPCMMTVSQLKSPVADSCHLIDHQDVQTPTPGGFALDGEPHGAIPDRDIAPHEPDPFGENGRCADVPIALRDDRQPHDLADGQGSSPFSPFLSKVIRTAADRGQGALLAVCAGARRLQRLDANIPTKETRARIPPIVQVITSSWFDEATVVRPRNLRLLEPNKKLGMFLPFRSMVERCARSRLWPIPKEGNKPLGEVLGYLAGPGDRKGGISIQHRIFAAQVAKNLDRFRSRGCYSGSSRNGPSLRSCSLRNISVKWRRRGALPAAVILRRGPRQVTQILDNLFSKAEPRCPKSNGLHRDDHMRIRQTAATERNQGSPGQLNILNHA
jgi:hypothetical protein